MNISGFLFAEFAAASLLICMALCWPAENGAVLVLAILFTLAYIFNEWLLLESGLFEGFLDTGGPWPSTPSGLTLAWRCGHHGQEVPWTRPRPPRQTRSATNSACWAA